MRVCPLCNASVEPQDRFCSQCGFDLSKTGFAIEKAPFGKRFVAALIDLIIISALCVPSIGSFNYFDVKEDDLFFVLGWVFLLMPLTYFFIKDGLGEGQSWGKKMMNIKVIHIPDLADCSFGLSTVRGLLRLFLNLFFPVLFAEIVMIFVMPEGRTVIDRIMGTMVVRREFDMW